MRTGRSRTTALALLVTCGACTAAPPRGVPPAAPATDPSVLAWIGDGSRASPFQLRLGTPRSLPIEVVTKELVGFVVEETADVVLHWSEGRIYVVGPDGVDARCDRDPCVLPLALKGPYHAILRTLGTATRTTISVSAGAPSIPDVMAPRTPKLLTMKPAVPGDPRGTTRYGVAHVGSGGPATIDLDAPFGAASPPVDDPSRTLSVQLHESYERADRRLTTTASPFGKGAVRITFNAGEDEYAFVTSAEGAESPGTVDIFPLKHDGVLYAKPLPGDHALPRLRVGDRVVMDVKKNPEPPHLWIDLPRGLDLILAWAPEDVHLSTTRAPEDPQSERLAWSSPDLYPRPPTGPFAVFASPTFEKVTLQAKAWALPPPPLSATLKPEDTVVITTAPLGADDPRGAMAEIALDFPPGHYDIMAEPMDPWGATRRDLGPLVRIVNPGGELIAHRFGSCSFQASNPGRYIVRIDGKGDAPPRRLRVSFLDHDHGPR